MRQKIIFKCDDLECLSDNVLLFDRIVKKYNLKASWGIIGRFIHEASEEYVQWISDKNLSGTYEFWNHGYSHGYKSKNDDTQYEFLLYSVKKQYRAIQQTQSLSKDKLGVTLACFGAPANKISWKTAIALLFCREIKGWFYGFRLNKYIFDRSVEIEFPCGHVDFKKFKDAYIKWGKSKNIITYQIHPNMWQDDDFQQFEKIIQYLNKQGVEFVLPRDIYLKNHP